MRDEMKGLFLAIILSIAVIFITNYFFPSQTPSQGTKISAPQANLPSTPVTDTDTQELLQAEPETTQEVIAKDSRIQISSSALSGSIRTKGGRLDNLMLEKYKQTLEEGSPDVELFAPAQTQAPYYAEFGWLSTNPKVNLPNKDTIWSVKGQKLTPETPIVMEWNNGQGLKFIRKISLDDN